MIVTFRLSLLILLIITSFFSYSHSSPYKESIDDQTIFSLIFSNDIFNKTDYYYTNGVLFDLKHPLFSKGNIKNIFITGGDKSSYSLSAISKIYTPENLKTSEIIYDDRPYCAYSILSYNKNEIFEAFDFVLNSELQVGVIGPAALGDKIQINLHKWLDNTIPKGWDNQIKNDIILNYNVMFDKRVYYNSYFALNSYSTVRVGTLHSDITIGGRADIGFLNYGFSGNSSWFDWNRDSWKFSLFADISGKLVVYDATLQGGLFNRNSPHTLDYSEITPVILQIKPGLMLQYKKFGMELRDIYSTKSFDNGKSHMWGMINLFFHI